MGCFSCLVRTVAALLITMCLPSQGGDTEDIFVAFLAVNETNTHSYSMARIGAAFEMALERVNENSSLLGGRRLEYTPGASNCNNLSAVSAALGIIEAASRVPDIFIGPACSYASGAVTMMAAHWNVPVITYAATRGSLSNKFAYPVLSRTVATSDIVAGAVLGLCEEYEWRRICVFITTSRGRSVHQTLSLNNVFALTANYTIVRSQYLDMTSKEKTRKTLSEATSVCRIIVVLAYTTQFADVMLAAYDEGFFHSNEYVFITLDTRHNKDVVEMSWMWTGDEVKDRKLDVAYQSLLHVITVPYFLEPEYRDFLEQVRLRLREPPWNSNLSSADEVSERAANLYDAVMLYALTADSMIRNDLDPRDGRMFTKHARTILFTGKTGDVSVNENNDRNENYIIMDYQNGSFVRTAYFDGFTKEYRPEGQVYWLGGSKQAPRDIPICGYTGELCIVDEKKDVTGTVVGAVLGLLAVFTLFGAGIFYRKKQFEAELLSASWKVNYADLMFGKDVRSSIHSMKSDRSFTHIDMAKDVAIYKSERVHVKNIRKQSVDWKKRSILLELKLMRDIRHDNLLTFVGACVEQQNVCVLTSYCPRGNLQDVLENDDIQLDLTFKISFAIDVISGLQCLQKSDVEFHGNLKSTNCLVDTRWTIKLSDYGLREFTAGAKADDAGDYVTYRNLLWTAPEHLRPGAPDVGSHKGDIYSFSILLHEIMVRSGAWGNTDLSPKEIVDKVISAPGGMLMRPVVAADDCPAGLAQLMAKCWAEVPANRPDLSSIRNALKVANGNRTINIMDNMVSMLEKYASNLEDIVAERTRQLMEEKKKTDTLLFQMLPQSVAEKLKHGKAVEAETYDLVTIFFSDIVGFTSLSARSTPMQVVDLLNDLYTTFDATLENFDVYKVETIGDAYMVASGLPMRNGVQHAGEIATMSLELLSVVGTFRIRHFPEHKLLLRVGIHSGPCVAGVVGLKMPRYCLFGDTVNTASRMESNGQALKVHVSGACKNILDSLGGYNVVERGMIEMKGKGVQMTYWLEGKTGFNKSLPKPHTEPGVVT